MKKISTLFTTLFLFCVLSINAQNDTTKNSFEKQFLDFKNSINKSFNDFKNKNDSIFYSFLEKSWHTFNLFKNERKSEPKPKVQPEIKTKPEVKPDIKITPINSKSINFTKPEKKPVFEGKAMEFNTENTFEESDYTTFGFFGDEVKIPNQEAPKTSSSGTVNRKVANYFKASCNDKKLLKTIKLLQKDASDKNLNGWGYFNLVKEASKKIYKNQNDRILFTWFALLKSGFDVRAGYDKKEVYLLANFDVPVYYSSYFELNGKKYYVILFEGQPELEKRISSYKGDYPGELQNLTLYLNCPPKFALKKDARTIDYLGEKIQVDCNENLIDFYKTYPECDLSVYFPVKLSDVAFNSLNDFLKDKMQSGNDLQKLNYLLRFVQYAIKYETDDRQFGKENYLFAEEVLFYPYADCEDRVIFLSHLVERYLGLKSIALLYDGHVSYAVNLNNENIDGAYVLYKGKKYYVADPTYIGARVGMIMDNCKNKKPEIIVLN